MRLFEANLDATRRMALAPTLVLAMAAWTLPAAAASAAEPAEVGGALLGEPDGVERWLWRRHPRHQASRAQRVAAGAAIEVAAVRPNPTVEVATTQLPIAEWQHRYVDPVPWSQTLGVEVGVRLPFEIGKREPRIRAALARRAAAEARAEQGLLEHAREARLALGRASLAATRVGLLSAAVRESEAALGLSQSRLQRGDLSRLDFDRLALEAESLRLELARAQAEAEDARADCAAVWLAPCKVEATAPGGWAEAVGLQEAVQAAGAAESSVHPAARSQRAEAEAARAEATLARARRLPDVELGVGYRYDGFIASGNVRHAALIGVAVPLPVFDRGEAPARAAEAEARAAELGAVASIAQVEAQRGALRQRAEGLRAARRALAAEALPRAERVVATTAAAVGRGQLALTELLLARRARLALQLGLLGLDWERFVVDAERRALVPWGVRWDG